MHRHHAIVSPHRGLGPENGRKTDARATGATGPAPAQLPMSSVRSKAPSASHQRLETTCVTCHTRNQSRSVDHIPNQSSSRSEFGIFYQIAQLTDHLYLSGARAVQFSRIVERGITCVVNATIELPNLPIPDVDYLKIPVDDTPYSNLFPYFDVAADKIAEIRKTGGKTLVHCIAGVSRSVSLCLAYLMKYEGMSLRKAYYHVKARRAIAHPNHGFFKQLIEYERRLFGRESVRMIHSASAGLIPDVYEDEYRNIMWMTTYKTDYNAAV